MVSTLKIDVGDILTLHTLRDQGRIISYLPDGKVVLFGHRSPYLNRLRPDQTVECQVVHINPRYIIVELIEDPLAGQDDASLREDLERLMGCGPEMAVIARALLYILDRFEGKEASQEII